MNITETIRFEVSEFRGKTRVDIRRWFQTENGEWRRSTKGINMELSEWQELEKNFSALQKHVQDYLNGSSASPKQEEEVTF